MIIISLNTCIPRIYNVNFSRRNIINIIMFPLSSDAPKFPAYANAGASHSEPYRNLVRDIITEHVRTYVIPRDRDRALRS